MIVVIITSNNIAESLAISKLLKVRFFLNEIRKMETCNNHKKDNDDENNNDNNNNENNNKNNDNCSDSNYNDDNNDMEFNFNLQFLFIEK